MLIRKSNFATYFHIFIIFSASCFAKYTYAEDIAHPTPHQRVRIPAQLTAPTLQKLLDTIEQPGVASALKVSYFGGRASTRGNAPSLPVAEGFALLKTSLAKETVASRRWFWLQNVRGWAAFRCKELSPDEGFAAYAELFAQADKARAAKEVLAPQLAISEWLAAISNRLWQVESAQGGKLRDDERTSKVLLAAWSAYVSLLQQTQGRWNGREPDWGAALQSVGASDEFVALVEKTLADPNAPQTFGFYNAAAHALRPQKPERALELFALAKPLLPVVPPDARGGQARMLRLETAQFFDDWSATLQGQKKTAEAIVVTRERIATTGSGYGDLLKFLLQSKDEAGIAGVLETLQKPDAPEREIVAAAEVFNDAWDKDRANQKLAAQSEGLLNGYLHSARTRNLSTEIEARYRLAWLLIENKKDAGAIRAALDVSHLQINEQTLTPQFQDFLQNIRAMQARLDTKADVAH